MNNDFIVFANVSTSYFSVARHASGATINGELFVYCPERDILIRDDWMKFYRRMPWENFVAAVKTGIKPTLPPVSKSTKRLSKTKEDINNNQLSLFNE